MLATCSADALPLPGGGAVRWRDRDVLRLVLQVGGWRMAVSTF